VKVFFDTSVLVASVVGEHPGHARAVGVARRAAAGQDQGYVAAHGLAEAYAVLTALPVFPRIGPETASKLVLDNLVEHFETVALTAREYARLLRGLPERGVVGGATYDAIHLACAEKAHVDRIYTFNLAHFRRLAPATLAARVAAP
jgi:predicted nucleic acid-binding protein